MASRGDIPGDEAISLDGAWTVWVSAFDEGGQRKCRVTIEEDPVEGGGSEISLPLVLVVANGGSTLRPEVRDFLAQIGSDTDSALLNKVVRAIRERLLITGK